MSVETMFAITMIFQVLTTVMFAIVLWIIYSNGKASVRELMEMERSKSKIEEADPERFGDGPTFAPSMMIQASSPEELMQKIHSILSRPKNGQCDCPKCVAERAARPTA